MQLYRYTHLRHQCLERELQGTRRKTYERKTPYLLNKSLKQTIITEWTRIYNRSEMNGFHGQWMESMGEFLEFIAGLHCNAPQTQQTDIDFRLRPPSQNTGFHWKRCWTSKHAPLQPLQSVAGKGEPCWVSMYLPLLHYHSSMSGMVHFLSFEKTERKNELKIVSLFSQSRTEKKKKWLLESGKSPAVTLLPKNTILIFLQFWRQTTWSGPPSNRSGFIPVSFPWRKWKLFEKHFLYILCEFELWLISLSTSLMTKWRKFASRRELLSLLTHLYRSPSPDLHSCISEN